MSNVEMIVAALAAGVRMIAAAKRLPTLTDPQYARLNITGSQGVQIGHGNIQTNHFRVGSR